MFSASVSLDFHVGSEKEVVVGGGLEAEELRLLMLILLLLMVLGVVRGTLHREGGPVAKQGCGVICCQLNLTRGTTQWEDSACSLM